MFLFCAVQRVSVSLALRHSLVKGQAAIELLAVLSLLIIISAFLIFVEADRESQVVSDKLRIDAKSVSETAAQEINTAAIVGDGYQHSFSLPQTIAYSTDYNVSIEQSTQTLSALWGEGLFQSSIIVTSNVSGNFSKGINSVKNQNGEIIIEQ